MKGTSGGKTPNPEVAVDPQEVLCAGAAGPELESETTFETPQIF